MQKMIVFVFLAKEKYLAVSLFNSVLRESVETVPLRGDVRDDVHECNHHQQCRDGSVGGDGVYVRLKAHRDEVQNGVHCDVFLGVEGSLYTV